MRQSTWAEHVELSALRRDGLAQRVAPFVAVALGAIVLSLALRPDRPGWVAVSGLLTLSIIAAAALMPWERWPRSAQAAVPVTYLGAIVALWASAPSATDAFAVLLGLPVLWSALYGRHNETMLVFTAAAAVLAFGGRGADGAADAGWTEAVMYAAVGALVATSVRRLVVDLERRERALRKIAELSREVDATEPRSKACRALVDLARADLAAFVVPGADAPVTWAAAAGATPLDPLEVMAPETVRMALEHDQPVIERDRASSLRVILVKPLIVEGRRLGAFVIGWANAHPHIGDLELSATRLVVATVADAVLRAQRFDSLDELSRTDTLTGLANRREWATQLPLALARAHRGDTPLVVAMGDIDHFKRFNDSHGHQAGDRLLAELGQRWAASVRDSDVLARYGGEEFVVAFPNCRLIDALQRVEVLRSMMPEGQTCSFGVALWDGEEDGDELVARADRALYAAKAAGRDRAVVDAPDSDTIQDGPLLTTMERS